VRAVSFDIGRRETVALVGESGSGKSMTALSIMGLVASDQCRLDGRIQFGGRDLLRLPAAEMRRLRGNEIAMIFQEPMTSLNPVLTVGDQIAEALKLHRAIGGAQAQAETIRLLDRVKIPGAAARFHEYPHQLSGGMRQRVMIAMALACEPRLLIADEPTTALDVTIQAEILDLIKSLQEDSELAVLFITHDMAVVAEVADRAVVMTGGEVVETDGIEALFSRPSHPYTRSLLAAIPAAGSMKGRDLPIRFPFVDRESGEVFEADEVPATVRPETIIEVENLTTRFDVRSGSFGRISGRIHAVENVSFKLHAGETLSLVGESGCGKTTVGRSIMGLIEPQHGVVKIDGRDVLRSGSTELREIRKRMQIIFQDPFASLDPRMRIGSAIAEPMIVHKLGEPVDIRRKVLDLMLRVGLTSDLFERYPHELSGGQRQRVCIARALALGPSVIVADESVSALDVTTKAQVINLLLDLQAEMGLAYLFISHDMAVVERVSHTVAVMYGGEIVEIGPRKMIFENPQHPYTKRLLAAVPIADPTLRTKRRALHADETRGNLRSLEYVPPVRKFFEVAPGHLVQSA
jgi:peptide/nickel transport system ATP-binding protein